MVRNKIKIIGWPKLVMQFIIDASYNRYSAEPVKIEK